MLDQIYNLTAGRREDYINPTTNCPVSWRSIRSFDSNSEETMSNQQDRNHQLSTRRCASFKSIRWIISELRDPPIYDGTGNFEDFLDAMEYQVAEEQQVPALDVVLKATPARWWETHKEDHTTWAAVQLAMLHQFVFPPVSGSFFNSWGGNKVCGAIRRN